MVIGTVPYEFVARHYRKPLVVSGFEPLDVLQSVWMVLRQIAEGRAEVENQYARVVADGGNAAAFARSRAVFELREFFEWRGLGSIDFSGIRFRDAYARFDAERRSPCRAPHRRPPVLPVRRSAEGRDQAAVSARSSAPHARQRRHSVR